MNQPKLRGVELYFEDLGAAKGFYRDLLGLRASAENAGSFVKFESGSTFLCLAQGSREVSVAR